MLSMRSATRCSAGCPVATVPQLLPRQVTPVRNCQLSTGLDAHELMVQALLLQPMVLGQVVIKLNDKGSAREPAWTVVLTRRPFRDADDGGSASLSHLVRGLIKVVISPGVDLA